MDITEITAGDWTFQVGVAGPPKGEPVLLLHGFPETGHMWRHAVDALAGAGYRAIAPDQRGYSPKARPSSSEAYATENMVGDALALMDALEAPTFHLVGHDWGGQLAWLIAAHQPERVRTLSMASRPHPAAFARAMAEDKAQSQRSGHHRSFRADDALQRMRATGLKPMKENLEKQGVPTASAELYMSVLLEPGGIEGAMSWYRAGSKYNFAETPPVSVPTIYFWGREDPTVGAFAAELTRKYVTGPYAFVSIEGGTHFVVDQFPDRVSQLIVDHIRPRN